MSIGWRSGLRCCLREGCASASNTANPRSFSLVIADDVSQNALSTFIGAFIYSIVALVALMKGYY